MKQYDHRGEEGAEGQAPAGKPLMAYARRYGGLVENLPGPVVNLFDPSKYYSLIPQSSNSAEEAAFIARWKARVREATPKKAD